MVDDRDGSTVPSSSRKKPLKPPRPSVAIVTVCIRGADRKPAPKTKRRTELLLRIVEAILDRPHWHDLDVVQFPGGYFRIPTAIGLTDPAGRRLALNHIREGTASAAASLLLAQRWPSIALAVGIDSNPIDRAIGGDQLNIAWQNGAVAALGRKAFPAAGDTDGSLPCYWVVPDDADDPGQILTLGNGARAFLLSCYDAFAVRALAGQRHLDLAPIKLIQGADRHLIDADPPARCMMRERWLRFLDTLQPDLGLIAIHRFARSGQDGYWQRHGIAGASAALSGRPIIAAAHIRNGLPALDRMMLAASGVPASHLDLGPRQLAHRALSDDGFVLHDKRGEAVALVSLFRFDIERSI